MQQGITYPLSATVAVKERTYYDDVQTLYNSSWTVQTSTWVGFITTGTVLAPFGDYTWINASQTVTGLSAVRLTSTTWNVQVSTWTLEDYTKLIIEETKFHDLNGIADNEEIFMVWFDTSPPRGWQGYCLSIINGHDVPIQCP